MRWRGRECAPHLKHRSALLTSSQREQHRVRCRANQQPHQVRARRHRECDRRPPNGFLEVGHTWGKHRPINLLWCKPATAERGKRPPDLPFDTCGQLCIEYKSIKELARQLTPRLSAVFRAIKKKTSARETATLDGTAVKYEL